MHGALLRRLVLSAFAVVVAACTGDAGPRGPAGPAGPMGPQGPGIDAGALAPSDGPVRIDASGTADAPVASDAPIGKPPVVTIAGATGTAGFGAPVTLTATATDPETPDVSKLAFKWAVKSGAPATLVGATTNTVTFTTWTVAQAKAKEDVHFGVLGISPDDTGNYSIEVAVTDPDGNVTRATASVKATATTLGLRNVPIGIKQYLAGDGAPQATWAWSLDLTGAPGSLAALADAATQFPSFTPDVMGIYKVTEAISGQTMSIEAGKWQGMMGDEAACKICHDGTKAPDQFTPWAKTAHGRALQAKIDGKDTSGNALTSFGRSCLSCHTVGDSPLADNNGFDDVERASTWKMPATLQSGNWAALVSTAPALAKLAGIQCENCHGPQNSKAHGGATDPGARTSFSGAACASCHQSGTHHYRAAQWDDSLHSKRELAVEDATWEARGTTAAHCGRCHTAQGFVAYTAQLAKGVSGNLTKPDGTAADEAYLRSLGLVKATVEPITCVACHDPHDATNPAQLRMGGDIKALPNGLTNIAGAGPGATCMACHNTRNGEHSDFVAAPTSLSGPHTPAQTDVLYGFNAYFMPRMNPSAHLSVEGTCAGCHVATPTAANVAAGQEDNHTFKADTTICAKCHSENTNGEALMAVNAAQLESLKVSMAAKFKATLDGLYAGGDTITVKTWDEATDFYSAAIAIPATALPTAVTLRAAIHGGIAWTLKLATPVTVTWMNAATPAVAQGTAAVSDLQVRIGDMSITGKTLPTDATKPLPVVAGDSVLFKATWNLLLLDNDGTRGIHNPTFFQNTVAATVNALRAEPNGPAANPDGGGI